MAATLLLVLSHASHSAALSVTVVQADGQVLPDAVVVVESQHGYTTVRGFLKSLIDQRNLMFMPEVLVVRTGTSVDFPNSDQVHHQVYSFSPAKKFQLPLYAGRTQPPVVFDRPGIITLGCNIHDGMIGHVYVTDSPWFGRTDARGVLQLTDLPAGNHELKVWHPRLAEGTKQIELPVTLQNAPLEVKVQLKKPLRNPKYQHGKDKRWQDY